LIPQTIGAGEVNGKTLKLAGGRACVNPTSPAETLTVQPAITPDELMADALLDLPLHLP
jgi:hypothetical protein